LKEHKIGHSQFTSTGILWILVDEEKFDDLPSGKRRETQVKKMKSRKYIESLIFLNKKESRFGRTLFTFDK